MGREIQDDRSWSCIGLSCCMIRLFSRHYNWYLNRVAGDRRFEGQALICRCLPTVGLLTGLLSSCLNSQKHTYQPTSPMMTNPVVVLAYDSWRNSFNCLFLGPRPRIYIHSILPPWKRREVRFRGCTGIKRKIIEVSWLLYCIFIISITCPYIDIQMIQRPKCSAIKVALFDSDLFPMFVI